MLIILETAEDTQYQYFYVIYLCTGIKNSFGLTGMCKHSVGVVYLNKVFKVQILEQRESQMSPKQTHTVALLAIIILYTYPRAIHAH